MSSSAPSTRDRRGRAYVPAVGPWLRPLLWGILSGFAVLGATGVYLASAKVLTWWSGVPQTTYFYFCMYILHLLLGFLILAPFIAFGFAHLVTSWKRPNKAAIRYGIMLLVASIILMISGLMLVRIAPFEIKSPRVRDVGYWLHVGTPILAILLYVQHRLAGPRIRWEWAKVWGGLVAVACVLMAILHNSDPRMSRRSIDPTYTFPSEVKLAGGKLISAQVMMADDYCMKCHKDAYDGWYHSAHHFSSFNNKFYLTSVRETREASMKRDGNTRAARWCAGCHDPVVLASGQFDNPDYNDVDDPTGQAGITCTSCHAITHTNSTRGNADYTIEEPQHYPFAFSENTFLQWVNSTLVKAKPEMHKRTFLKPEVHRDSKFCSTCHKVSLPFALNHYQDFTRGQNHWDTFVLSGVSGGNARAFYYPPEAKTQCGDCHMPLKQSTDFGAQVFDAKKPGPQIHDHMFPAANSALPALRGQYDVAAIHEKYLKDKKVRIDLFALREGGDIEGKLLGPLRPEVPTLKPGGKYLVETVVRTLGVGHPLTQGTVDSNEIWVELTAKDADGKILGRSGGIGEDGTVDPFSHFINVYMLDRDGHRIDRRNPQDIFVPLYNKQIPPGAGQVVHFGLEVPDGVKGPIALEAKVNYRKFDRKFRDYIFGPGKGPEPPVVVMASDLVNLPIEGGPKAENTPSPIPEKEAWQRWNDYGIGLFLEGADKGGQKGELKQAEPVFQKVAELGQVDGWINLARVYQREGRIPDALAALEKASKHENPKAPWTVAWLSAQIDERNGFLDEAIAKYRSVLETKIPDRKFDFSVDFEVRNAMGIAQIGRAKLFGRDEPERRPAFLDVVETFRKTLAIDSENVNAHYNLGIAYSELAKDAPAPAKRSADPATSADVGKALDSTVRASTPQARAEASAVLRDVIERFLRGPRPKLEARMTPLLAVVEGLGPIFEKATDPAEASALAATLATTHKSLHSMYKPDETAEGRAQKLAREANPAADMNAQSIVIHPLHRRGAPGLAGTTPTANAPASTIKKREDSE